MNKMRILPLMIILSSSIILLSCKGRKLSSEQSLTNKAEPASFNVTAAPTATVYKTIADYNNRVPITMNTDKTEIISYPDPFDVNNTSQPTILQDGYLLDNRGITENVAFLRYTYTEYSALAQAPSLDELKQNIIEKYPLLELIHCGNRYTYKNEVEELNALIASGFPGCRRIEIVRKKAADGSENE